MDMLNYLKSNMLNNVRHIVKQEDTGEIFAIALVDILMDEVWTKEQFIELINESLHELTVTINEDINDNDDEHARAFEREIRKGL